MLLYDQFNRPIMKSRTKPVTRPLATAPLTNAWREYVADGLTPVRLAGVLKEADAGDLRRQAELFDQIEERDAHIIGEISKRKNVILEADFELTPASDDARDIKIAEDVEMMFSEITDWADVLVSLQDAVGKGFSAIELEWDVSEGQAVVENFKFLEQKRFLFTDESGILSAVPRLITDTDAMGVEIPSWKMLLHKYGGKSGHAVNSGIYRICAWWYLFKNYAIKDWAIFCEVYGMPLRLGKYDQGASEEDINALEIAVRTLGSDAAGVISKATEIEFITGSKSSASTDLYENLAGFANKEMSKAILGATLTADSDGKGSYALGNVHNDVRIDLINADVRAIATTIRSQLIKPYVGFNYGWDASVPKYSGRYKKENLREHAEMLDKLADRMDIPVSHVREKYYIPEPQEDEEILRSKNNRSIVPTKAKQHIAKIQTADIVNILSGQAEEKADKHINSMLKPIKKILSESKSMQDLKAGLMAELKDMESPEMGELIAKVMATASLFGQYEVDQNV